MQNPKVRILSLYTVQALAEASPYVLGLALFHLPKDAAQTVHFSTALFYFWCIFFFWRITRSLAFKILLQKKKPGAVKAPSEKIGGYLLLLALACSALCTVAAFHLSSLQTGNNFHFFVLILLGALALSDSWSHLEKWVLSLSVHFVSVCGAGLLSIMLFAEEFRWIYLVLSLSLACMLSAQRLTGLWVPITSKVSAERATLRLLQIFYFGAPSLVGLLVYSQYLSARFLLVFIVWPLGLRIIDFLGKSQLYQKAQQLSFLATLIFIAILASIRSLS